jgi:hypothetical protein
VVDNKLSWLCIDYNIYYIRIKYNKINFEFRCSYKILPLPLSKLAQYLCDGTQKMIFPYKILQIDYLKKSLLELNEGCFNTSSD